VHSLKKRLWQLLLLQELRFKRLPPLQLPQQAERHLAVDPLEEAEVVEAHQETVKVRR
jgi:hypothetical protein